MASTAFLESARADDRPQIVCHLAARAVDAVFVLDNAYDHPSH
jgi:hypothetical protein